MSCLQCLGVKDVNLQAVNKVGKTAIEVAEENGYEWMAFMILWLKKDDLVTSHFREQKERLMAQKIMKIEIKEGILEGIQ
jgi:hypothetical protein